VSTPFKLITCIMHKGKAHPTAVTIRERFAIHSIAFHTARGVGRSAPLSKRGTGQQPEKDVLLVAVAEDCAEALFEFLYHEAGIGQPHGGFMFQQGLPQAGLLSMPDVAELPTPKRRSKKT